MADEGFQQEFLTTHNTYRQMHQSPPLKLSGDLNVSAQRWADHLLNTGNMEHSGSDDGENIYCMSSSAQINLTGKEAVESWYGEVKDYDFDSPGFKGNTGHFTQVVWKESTELGVGLATDGNKVFVVGQYRPAGNMNVTAYFERNVLPQDEGFQQEFLTTHNTYRQMHQSPPLKLSGDLNVSAQRWADHLLNTGNMEHSGSDDGENIYCMSSSAQINLTGKEAVESWYGEVKDYDYDSPGFKGNTGHFTQVVWKESMELGVGLATDGNKVFVVGQYRPGGNMNVTAYFERNVLPQEAMQFSAGGGGSGGTNSDGGENNCTLL